MNQTLGVPVTQAGLRPAWKARLGLSHRRTWLILGALLLVGGAALNWSWLVAVGIAPLLLAVAPCAAMCGLGLCMKGGGSCKKQNAEPTQTLSTARNDEMQSSRT